MDLTLTHVYFLLLQVVLNKAISKTQKVSFFTPVVLANIASLYKWNGLVDVSTDDNVSSSYFFFLVWDGETNLIYNKWV